MVVLGGEWWACGVAGQMNRGWAGGRDRLGVSEVDAHDDYVSQIVVLGYQTKRRPRAVRIAHAVKWHVQTLSLVLPEFENLRANPLRVC